MQRDCPQPHKYNDKSLCNVEEAMLVNDVAQSMP